MNNELLKIRSDFRNFHKITNKYISRVKPDKSIFEEIY